ncbi:MAG: helix-hairpin-helix domain-containing protein [Clostridiales bacterium]|nr:helix-hairpin-helix domain-containing protein [Clostridiales bacterium]
MKCSASSIRWKRYLYVLSLIFTCICCLGCRGLSRSLFSGGSVVTQAEDTQYEGDTQAEEGILEDEGQDMLTENGTQTEKGDTREDDSLLDTVGDSSTAGAAEVAGTADGDTIFVHICGCVKNPGLYELPEGIRAGNAIEEAGGFTKKADQTAVNLAEILADGVQLYIPAEGETGGTVAGQSGENSMFGQTDGTSVSGQSDTAAEGNVSGSGAVDSEGRVNINEASLEELMTLSGIGEARAQAILSYREENGSFSSIEDIKNVSGIGDGIFDKIKDKIIV